MVDLLHRGGPTVERQGLCAAKCDAGLTDEGDGSRDAARDTLHGGTANVPSGLRLRGLGDAHFLHHRLTLVVGDGGNAHDLGGIGEEVGLTDSVVDIADVLGVGVPVDDQHLVMLVPVLSSIPGQEESFKPRVHLPQPILVFAHVSIHARAGPDGMTGHGTIGATQPLKDLKVVFVHQDLESFGGVLAFAVGVVAGEAGPGI